MRRIEKKMINKDFMNSMKQGAEGNVPNREFKTEKVRQEVEESEYQLERVEQQPISQPKPSKVNKETTNKREEAGAHHYRVLSNDVGAQKAERSDSSNFTITAEPALHSKTEDRRREIDLNEPMLKIRKVAVMDPRRQNSEVHQLARQVNLKSETAAP